MRYFFPRGPEKDGQETGWQSSTTPPACLEGGRSLETKYERDCEPNLLPSQKPATGRKTKIVTVLTVPESVDGD